MKYVLVTGACGGMGRKTVSALKNSGYTVFALDKYDYGSEENVVSLQADITDSESIRAAFEKVSGITNELHAILHFAGVYVLDSLVEVEKETLKKVFDVNFFGAFEINKIFMPLMKKGGKIIITTSELAPLDPLPFTGIYAIAKSTLDKYAYSLAMELQLKGVTVSVLRAGAVDTDMLGVSTDALDRFCSETQLYSCNAKRFKSIVNKVEARNISAEKIACKMIEILEKKRPGFVYSINRNPLLLLLNLMPKRFQLWAIKQVLK